MNLGKNSETLSSLRESDHTYPRPFIFGIFEAVSNEKKPNITLICYDMNDGI